MKELSIEEKAKAYDEAIRKAKISLDCCDSASIATKNTIYDIFPELAENEDKDEWMRKNCIHFLELQKSHHAATFEIEECIDWLEKQKPQGKTTLEAINEEKVDNSNRVEPKNYNSIDPHFANPIDKVEPKFHKGDWVIHQGTENIYQVVAVIDNQYHLKYGDNYTLQKCADVDRCARLWDITKDAKDGDVLVAEYGICSGRRIGIYKKSESDYWLWGSYCSCEADGRFNSYDLVSFMEGTHPATKEQRDTLMRSMSDAGYTFDFKKKELKTIEQSKLTAFEEEVKDMMNDYRDAIGDCPVTIEEIKDRAAYMLSLIPQKITEWSEEDEKHVKSILSTIECCKVQFSNIQAVVEDYNADIEWLKSLRPHNQ